MLRPTLRQSGSPADRRSPAVGQIGPGDLGGSARACPRRRASIGKVGMSGGSPDGGETGGESQRAGAPERRLAAILAADIVGYARLIERDERGTLDRVKLFRLDVLEPLLVEHRGRLVKLTGDGALCEFSSVVAAVACGVAIQRAMTDR